MTESVDSALEQLNKLFELERQKGHEVGYDQGYYAGYRAALTDARERLRTMPIPELPSTVTNLSLDASIDKLGWAKEITNPLISAGILTIKDLTEVSEGHLLDLRNFGPGRVRVVKFKLSQAGYSLSDTPPDYTRADAASLKDPIDELGMSTRARNKLVQNDIKTIKDLTKWTKADLEAIPGINWSTIREVEAALGRHDYKLAE